MATNTKALRVRIKSVSSTLQLTKAMELVASSKIRRANAAMLRAREYVSALKDAMELFCANREAEKNPYFRSSVEPRTRLVVIAGDRGLAGGYNANVFRLAKEFENAEVYPIGKRACDRFGKRANSSETFSFAEARDLADVLCSDFIDGRYDRLGIVYTNYRSVISQDAVVFWVLPLEAHHRYEADSSLFEPDFETALAGAVQEYVAGLIVSFVRESFASEVSARRMAMDSAGKNAREMIDRLQLEYNRARQGAITQEITEIVAGSGDE